MINKDRVRTMTRLAIYEMVGSFVSGTIACLLIALVYCCYHYDTLLIQLFENQLMGLIRTAATLYAAFMIFFLAVSFFVYLWRINALKGRLDRYNRRLEHLKESYEKEDKHADKRF